MKELNFLLTRNYIDFKPAQLHKDKEGTVFCNILAYKTARTDMDILDDCVGSMMWQNKYKRDSQGVLQCGIAVFSEDLGDWVWKWSNGVPSEYEKEKGEYSDAFKRAGFMWGIGRCLYEFPRIVVQLNDSEWYEENGKPKANFFFKPNIWRWTITGTIGDLKIIAEQKFGNTYKERLNTKPYKK